MDNAAARSGASRVFIWLNRTMLGVIWGVVFYLILTKLPDVTFVLLPNLGRMLDYSWAEVVAEITAALRLCGPSLNSTFATVSDKSHILSLQVATKPWSLGVRDKVVLLLGLCDISVIVPALNEEKYLARCLGSLANQCFDGDYEVIVVDGGSTDHTVEIAERFADRVIFARRPVGAARNEGARLANGSVLAFIDADTTASECWLNAIERSFEDRNIIGVTGPTLPSGGTTIDSVAYKLWTIYLQKVLLSMGMPHVIGFNCAYRTEPFLQVGGFDETRITSEDIKLALKMRRFGRIRFERNMSALTSARRFRRYGWAYIATFYVFNGISTVLFDRSSGSYPPVR